MGIPHLLSYLKEEEITPTQTLCTGNTQEFRSKMQQSLATWKNQATISSFRPISLLNILPQGDEEQLRAQHQDILKKISMLQTMVRMAGAKAIDISHKEKGNEQTHTWDSMNKTCTHIVYSQTVTESDDTVQIEDGEEEEKGTSDDEPENETLAKVKRIPRRSLFMEEMTMPLPKPHTTPEKITIVPDIIEDNLELSMTKTQELIQDAINNLFSTTEKLTKMKNSIKTTESNELDSKTPRSILEINYKFLEMRFNEALAHNTELLHTVHELLEEQDNLRNERQLNDNESELKLELDTMRVE